MIWNAVKSLMLRLEQCDAAGLEVDYEALVDQISEDEGVDPDVLMGQYLAVIGGEECDEVL